MDVKVKKTVSFTFAQKKNEIPEYESNKMCLGLAY